MASSTLVKIACVAVMCMVMAAPFAQAGITCGQVGTHVAPCIQYLQGNALSPGRPCCNGVSGLNSMANSTPDRQTACKCLKQLAAETKVNYALAGKLPGQCGVHIPYPIAQSTDCSKVR